MLDIVSLFTASTPHSSPVSLKSNPAALQSPSLPQIQPPSLPQTGNMRELLKNLNSLVKIFDRRLSFSYNDQLNRIIVKVFNKNTETVIKELPPEDVQKMLARVKEALGMLVDRLV